MKIIDTHQHLIDGQKFKYDWTADIEELKSNDFSMETYADLAKKAGITSAIFMEAGVNDEYSQAESQLIANKINENTITQAVIAGCFPENEQGFDEWLDRTGGQKYVGYRRILHVVNDEISQSDVFIQNIRKIGNRNKAFDMCFLQRQLPLAIKLAQQCENTQLILDHCGVPNIADGDFSGWAEDITELAKLANVSCKISGILAYCPKGVDLQKTIAPYVEHCIESFGWNRVVWGSDWPVVNMVSNLKAWVDISKSIVKNEDVFNQQKLFHENANRIYSMN